jgi:hypothetical protein
MSSEPKIHERRRGERVFLRIPIKASGTGKDGKRVNENGHVAVVNRNGALIRLKNPLKPGSTVEILNDATTENIVFNVVWVSERAREGQFDIGVELTEPREEFWGIRFPPPERVST